MLQWVVCLWGLLYVMDRVCGFIAVHMRSLIAKLFDEAASPPLDNIWALLIVWRVREKITEKFCAVFYTAVDSIHKHTHTGSTYGWFKSCWIRLRLRFKFLHVLHIFLTSASVFIVASHPLSVPMTIIRYLVYLVEGFKWNLA